MKPVLYRITHRRNAVTGDPFAIASEGRFKKYGRQGFPEEHRRAGWSRGIGLANDDAYIRRSKIFYIHALQDVFHDSEVGITFEISQIPTFGSKMKWTSESNLTVDQINSCGRLLCVLRELADLRYGPIIPHIVALLVQYLEEHECYTAITSMSKRKDDFYFSPTKLGLVAQLETLTALCGRFLPPPLSAHIVFLSKYKVSEMMSDWMSGIFTGWLQHRHVLRVMDSFVIEGSKVMYRFTLAILLMHGDLIMASKNEDEMVGKLKAALAHASFDFDRLSVSAFAAIPLKRAYIKALVPEMETLLSEKSTVEDGSFIILAADDLGRKAPKMTGGGKLLTLENLRAVLPSLPERLQSRDVELVFSTDTDGFNIEALFNKGAPHGPNLLLIRTVEGSIIGCFASHAWRKHTRTFGNYHCFVFSVPMSGNNIRSSFSGGGSFSGRRSSFDSSTLLTAKQLAMSSTPQALRANAGPSSTLGLEKAVSSIQGDGSKKAHRMPMRRRSHTGDLNLSFTVYHSIEFSDDAKDGAADKIVLDEDQQWNSLGNDVFRKVTSVTFKKGPLGIKFETDVHGYGAVIKTIIPGGQAEEFANKIEVSDVLIFLNDVRCIGMDHEYLMTIIRQSSDKTDRVLGFVKSNEFYVALSRGLPSSQLNAKEGGSLVVPELVLGGNESSRKLGDRDSRVVSDTPLLSMPDLDLNEGLAGPLTPRSASDDGLSVGSDDEEVANRPRGKIGSTVTPYWSAMSPATLAAQPAHVYMMATSNYLIMGTSRNQSFAALKILGNLKQGSSDPTVVFNNPPLHGGNNSRFDIALIELYTFTRNNIRYDQVSAPTPPAEPSNVNLQWNTPHLKPVKSGNYSSPL